MKDFTKNIGEVPHLIVSQTEENLTMWKETLKSLSTKVKSSVLYLIFVMVSAHLFLMLVQIISWTFKQSVSLFGLRKQERLKQNPTSWVKEKEDDINFV